jgi:hypothetical protein
MYTPHLSRIEWQRDDDPPAGSHPSRRLECLNSGGVRHGRHFPNSDRCMTSGLPGHTRGQVIALRRPTAWIPLAMSMAAFAVVLFHIVAAGTARQADEGTEAHVWQLLMAGQLPIIATFAVRWLPRARQAALLILALQLAAGLGAATPVYLLRW